MAFDHGIKIKVPNHPLSGWLGTFPLNNLEAIILVASFLLGGTCYQATVICANFGFFILLVWRRRLRQRNRLPRMAHCRLSRHRDRQG